jgi:hypothetical protein
MDGLYFVPDKNLCVYDCSYVIIDPSEADQSAYYLDSNSRQCLRWGDNCGLCKDDHGCLECIKSDDASKSFYLSVTDGIGSWVDCDSSLNSCLLCSDSSTCTMKDSKVLATDEAWDDSNCRICETDKATCNSCKNGYVNTLGAWVLETCTVTNWMDCPNSVSADWDVWMKGYFLQTSTSCTNCSSNCATCSSASTCTLWNSGYILSTTGTCISTCSDDEHTLIERIDPPQLDIFEKKYCQASAWHSSCETWLNNDSADNQCTSWVLGFYLNLIDDTKMTGTWDAKAAKSNSNEIIIFVSNLAADISRAESDQTGAMAAPYVDLMKAIAATKSLMAPYSQNADGSLVTIRIALFVGDHFVLKKDYKPIVGDIDNNSLHYKIHISPYFWSLEASPAASKCLSSEDDTVNVYVKIGQEFTIRLPEQTYISNIIFDFTDSIIPSLDDPQGCLQLRERCCELSSSGDEELLQVTPGQTETCELRRLPRLSNALTNLNVLFYVPGIYETTTGISSPAIFEISKCTFKHMYFQYGSLIFLDNAGYVYIKDSVFTELSSAGFIVTNSHYQHFQISPSTETYRNAAIEKPYVEELSDGCILTMNCHKIYITDSEFTNFYTFVPETAYVYRVASTYSQFGVIINLQYIDSQFIGNLLIENNLFSNIVHRYTMLESNWNTQTESFLTDSGQTTILPVSSLFCGIEIDGTVFVFNNKFEDIMMSRGIIDVSFYNTDLSFWVGTCTRTGWDNPQFLFIKNTLERIANYNSITGLIAVQIVIPQEVPIPDTATDIMTYFTTTSYLPWSHIVFDRNTISYMTPHYENSGLTYFLWDKTSTPVWISSVLTETEISTISFNAIPVAPYSVTIDGETYEYDLNKVTFSNNKFLNCIYHRYGTLRLSNIFRLDFHYNYLNASGFFVESVS